MDAPQKKDDVVLLHSPTADGEGIRVLRARDNRLEAGEVRPLREGKPLHQNAELVTLKPRESAPFVCDVESSTAIGVPASGPPQIATKAYRESWERIFTTNPREDEALN
jgi:hypothetical protein